MQYYGEKHKEIFDANETFLLCTVFKYGRKVVYNISAVVFSQQWKRFFYKFLIRWTQHVNNNILTITD